MRHGWKLPAIVVLAGLVLASTVQAQTTLRYKFKEGEKIEYVVDMSQKSATNVLGQDIDQTMKMAIELTWQTLKVDEKGNAQAKVTVSRVKMKLEGGPIGKIELDSNDKDEPENLFGQMFAGMVKGINGMEMTFTVSPSGEVTDAKVKEGKGKRKMPDFGGLGGEMFGPDTMKSTIQGSIIIPLPKEPISKDKSWSHKVDEKTAMGRVISDTKYTYVGEVEKGGKKLDKLAINQPEIKIEPGDNAKVKIKVKNGSGKGTALFDNAVGRIVDITSDTKMQMEVEAAGVNADVNVAQTTTISINGTRKKGESKNSSSEKK